MLVINWAFFNNMSSEEDIYQDHVMDHYEDPYHRGDLTGKTHSGNGKNPLCGDVVSVELEIDDSGLVKQAYFRGEGCCISQASASMLMEAVEGKTVEQVKAMEAAEMLKLFGPKLTPNRQKCCLLPWRVLQTAIFSPVSHGEASS
jgi:nitrogen fixation NifU-like protein